MAGDFLGRTRLDDEFSTDHTGSAKLNNDEKKHKLKFCVASATGCPENLEFSKPAQQLTERAQMGAAWRACCVGASRCLGAGCVKSAPLRF